MPEAVTHSAIPEVVTRSAMPEAVTRSAIPEVNLRPPSALGHSGLRAMIDRIALGPLSGATLAR